MAASLCLSVFTQTRKSLVLCFIKALIPHMSPAFNYLFVFPSCLFLSLTQASTFSLTISCAVIFCENNKFFLFDRTQFSEFRKIWRKQLCTVHKGK